jgi:hypothetical protein
MYGPWTILSPNAPHLGTIWSKDHTGRRYHGIEAAHNERFWLQKLAKTATNVGLGTKIGVGYLVSLGVGMCVRGLLPLSCFPGYEARPRGAAFISQGQGYFPPLGSDALNDSGLARIVR